MDQRVYQRTLLYSHFVPLCLAIAALTLLLCAGCEHAAGYLPMPPQRAASEGRDPGELGNFIRMGDPFADEYIVRDVTSEKAPWRWTFARPELKLRVQDAANLRFVMEFTVPQVTFRDTGPITVACYVNDRLLGSMRCPRAGVYRFEKPVPEGWVKPGSEVVVRAEVDKRWVSKADGQELGFLLGAIGFPRER
jgi:hypothetical protein